MLAREIRDRRERDHRHHEVEIARHGAEQRRRVAAEAHAHDANARRASLAQHAHEHAQIGDGLAKALVREARVGSRVKVRSSMSANTGFAPQ